MENSILSELKYGNTDVIRSNTTTPSPNLSMSESDLSNVIENNMRSIIENSDNSTISSQNSYHYGNNNSHNNHNNSHNNHNSHSNNTSSTPIAQNKQGSFFATFLGGYQNRGNSILSPAFKSRSTVLSTPNNSHIGHTSSMHDFVPESGIQFIDFKYFRYFTYL